MIEGQDEALKLVRNILTDEEILKGKTIDPREG